MTSADIRQSFLDFFREKQHTIVPSSPLLPDAPNLLFTNAGMNQFVPIFLAQQKPPWKPPRVVDTQKCIRAGGKHNDLEDVGLDTYHHTFFEMLGNWSFGDYFKKEAIEWAWELLVERWKFPPERLYATVYQPGPGEPSEFDQEAYDHWARLFREADLDPKVHVLSSGKADNFWMMGDTGPCGPCSEVHVDLTPDGDTRGALVNKNDPRCIEIWNLVFIQFNANPDGSFTPLPQRHVDTGMGFERAVAIIQGTKNLTDFSGTTSNYETDVFRPIFDEIEKLSGKKYASTLPTAGHTLVWRRRRLDTAAATKCRTSKKRSTSPSASSPITFARFRSRSLTESSHQTKVAVTFCVAFCVARFATAARSVFTSRSFSNLSMSWRKRWATSFQKSATQQSKRSKKQFAAKKNRLTKRSIKGSRIFDAAIDARCDDEERSVRVSRSDWTIGRSCLAGSRVQTLRHLRVSARSHRTDGARAGLTVDVAGFREIDGANSVSARARPRRRRKSVLKKASSKSSRRNFLGTIFSRRNQLSKPFCRAKNRTK